MVENAALFVGYRQVQRLIRRWSGQDMSLPEDDWPALSLSQLVVAGAASGALASFVLTPVELVKCKLQVQLASSGGQQQHRTIVYRGPLHVISHTIQQNGFRGFYRGYLATLIRETGGGAFWFGVYEYACEVMMRRKKTTNKKDLTAPELMLAGGLGGAGYNFSFYPVDVIKSQMQTDQELLAGSSRSFIQTAKEIYRGGGIPGFYRGCGITVARSLPTSAIIFLTYASIT